MKDPTRPAVRGSLRVLMVASSEDASAEQFDGKVQTFFSLVHPDELASVQKASQAALRGERPYDIDHRIVRPGGPVRWVHEQADVVREARG